MSDSSDSSSDSSNDGPWYRDGLRFACTECGKCCSGGQGYVWLTDADLFELSRLLELTMDAFGRRFVRRVGVRYALIDRGRSGDCVFLEEKKCRVYAARPRQCRTYPWWKENLTSPEAWAAEAEDCEGINDEAVRVSAVTIREALKG